MGCLIWAEQSANPPCSGESGSVILQPRCDSHCPIPYATQLYPTENSLMEWKNETKQTGAENEFDPLFYIIQHIERLISPIVDKDRQRNRQHDKNE